MRGHERCRRAANLLHLGRRHVRDRRDVVRRRAGAGVGSSPMLRRRRRPVFRRDRELDVEVGPAFYEATIGSWQRRRLEARTSQVRRHLFAYKRRLSTAPRTDNRSHTGTFENRAAADGSLITILSPHLWIEDLGRERSLRVVGRRLVAHGDVHQRRVDRRVGQVPFEVRPR